MRLTETFPARCKKYVWVGRMQLDVDDACVIVNIEHLLPGFASIDGLVEPSFFVFGVQCTHGTYPYDIRVGRMHLDLTNVVGVEQAHHLPVFTPID